MNNPWMYSKWSLEDHELIQEICAKWGIKDILWKNANWKWSECSMGPIPPTPIIIQQSQSLGVDATTLIQPWLIEPWNPYTANNEYDKKRKRLIKLICKIKGLTYEEEKKMGMMNISVNDIKIVVKEIANIDLNIKKLEE